MFVNSVEVENYFNFTGRTSFRNRVTILVAANGGGKTTCLNIIGATTGTPSIRPWEFMAEDFKKVRVEVTDDNGDQRVLEMHGGLDIDQVIEFRESLSNHSRWVCTPPYADLESYGRPEEFVVHPNKNAIMRELFGDDYGRCTVAPNGEIIVFPAGNAQGWVDQYLGRNAPNDLCPMLYDLPERSLDLGNQRKFNDHVIPKNNQVIMVTHSPCMIAPYDDSCIDVWSG